MTYALDVDRLAQDQINALPAEAARALSVVWTFLQLTLWAGQALHAAHPRRAVRTVPFASLGLVTYLILEDQQRVDVLAVLWL